MSSGKGKMTDEQIEKELRKPKTHKGRKIKDDKAPKLIEGPQKTLCIQGQKTSQDVSEFLKDIFLLKKDFSLNFSRRHDIHPFEDHSMLEQYCERHDCGMFVFVSNSKKRSNNVVIGRMYNNSLLDMVEFGVQNFRSMSQFPCSLIPHARPAIQFLGDVWEFDIRLIKIKNILLDIFVENIEVKSLDIMKGLTHCVTFAATEGCIYMRVYEIHINSEVMENNDDQKNGIELSQIGPSADLQLRREIFPSEELWKLATKVPKTIQQKSLKNVFRDNVGDQLGQVYVDQQNLDIVALKKRQKLKDNEKVLKKQARLQKEITIDPTDI